MMDEKGNVCKFRVVFEYSRIRCMRLTMKQPQIEPRKRQTIAIQ